MSSERVIVFLKAPRPGLVKTRIAAALDEEAAAGIYRVLLDRTLRALYQRREVELRFTPDGADAEIQPYLRPGWTMQGQGEGDLGERMSRAVDESFAAGMKRVVIVGTDCPTLLVEDFLDAFDALNDADVVLGPAEDGGSWLIGLRKPAPTLFHGIPWSSQQVLALTEARARTAGLSVGVLRRMADIDTLEDWRRWLREGPL